MIAQQMATTSTVARTNTLSIATMLRLEGLIVFAATVALYGQVSGQWVLFLVLFLAPDLAFIGVMLNKELGRHIYNTVHTYSLAIGLAALAYFANWETVLAIALIWTAHIALDRLVGYGLKYSIDGKVTHLQRV